MEGNIYKSYLVRNSISKVCIKNPYKTIKNKQIILIDRLKEDISMTRL